MKRAPALFRAGKPVLTRTTYAKKLRDDGADLSVGPDQTRVKSDASHWNKVFKSRTVRYAGNGKGPRLVAPPHAQMQRNTTKISYMARPQSNTWGVHASYLEREGAQKEGEAGLGFNATGDVGLKAVLTGWYAAGDPRLFKIIISPEFGDNVDLQAFTRKTMKLVANDVGGGITWAAINHHNTSHPHVHIVIRGVTENGRPLSLAPEYIQSGIRKRASEALTEMLGYRTQLDMLNAKEKTIKSPRFTTLDRELLAKSDADGLVDLTTNALPGLLGTRANGQYVARLVFLEDVGLAKQADGRWLLSQTLKQALQAMQRATDRQKAMANNQMFITDSNAKLKASALVKEGQCVIGRVVANGLDESDRYYSLIEGVDHKVHYVTHKLDMERELPPQGSYVAMEVKRDATGTLAVDVSASHEVTENIALRMFQLYGNRYAYSRKSNTVAARMWQAANELRNSHKLHGLETMPPAPEIGDEREIAEIPHRP